MLSRLLKLLRPMYGEKPVVDETVQVIVEAPALRNKTVMARVNHLKRNGEYELALSYVLKEINAHESDRLNGCAAAPWYYWEAAILYRRLKRYDDEVALIQRFAALKIDEIGTSAKFLTRLPRAQELAAAAEAVQMKMDLTAKPHEPSPPGEGSN